MSKKKRYGLLKGTNRPKVREFLDFDYLDKLNDSELDWLNKFSTEFYGATFRNDDTDLHQTVIKRRAIYNTNNARTRDAYNQWNQEELKDIADEDEEDEK